jgi:hypothetical protein
MTDPVKAAIQAIDSHVPEGDMEEKETHFTIARVMVAKYHELYQDSPWQAKSVERESYKDLINPTTQRSSRTWILGGKMDVSILHKTTSDEGVMDHKTTSEEIADPHAAYWKRQAIESQLSHYALLEWIGGRKLDGQLLDVVRRPAIRPKAIPKTSKDGPTVKSVLESSLYYGQKVSEESYVEINESFKAGEKVTENQELYGHRLAALLGSETDKYFQRKWIPRLDADLVEYAREIWQSGKSMLADRKASIHPRSPEACDKYGRPCQYLDVCCGEDNIDSDNWKRVDQVHTELDHIPETNGLSILTNSRLKCNRLCQRLHFYKYELGLRRVDETPSIALQFGNLWHAAMNAYHRALLPEQPQENENVDSAPSSAEEVVPSVPKDASRETSGHNFPW